MLSRLHSMALAGIEATGCEIEVDVASRGFANAAIVGLPDTAVKESLERVRSALRNSGYDWPKHKTVINLAPADIKKEGPAFDLPIALGMIFATEEKGIGGQKGDRSKQQTEEKGLVQITGRHTGLVTRHNPYIGQAGDHHRGRRRPQRAHVRPKRQAHAQAAHRKTLKRDSEDVFRGAPLKDNAISLRVVALMTALKAYNQAVVGIGRTMHA